MKKLLCLFFALAMLSGCHTLHHKYSGNKQLTPGTKLTQNSARIGTVQGSKKAFYLFFGLIPLNSPSGPSMVDSMARKKFGDKFDGITHIKIREEMGVLSSIVNVFVGFIFSMMDVEVEGQVHRFEKDNVK